MNLDEVKLKTSSQLNEDEKEFIRSNQDKLDDEDKLAYAEILSSGEELPEAGEEENSVSETPSEETPSEEDPTPPVDDKSTEPAAPAPVFKTEEEARAFVKAEMDAAKKVDGEAKQKAIDDAKTPEEKKYVEDNWMPKDWNEASKVFIQKAKEEIKAEQDEEAKRKEENGKRLQAEWEEVSKANNIPGIDTKEGQKIHDQIVDVAVARNIHNFKDAHAEWLRIPKEFGGGYDPVEAQKTVEAEKQKKELASRKAAAAKLTGQNPGGAAPKSDSELPEINYDDLKKGKKLITEAVKA